ncbi:MAG: DUF5518 domain-containing protein [Pyrobaculum sp.]|jgi:hypothetical protein
MDDLKTWSTSPFGVFTARASWLPALRDLHPRWGCKVALSKSISRWLEPSLLPLVKEFLYPRVGVFVSVQRGGSMAVAVFLGFVINVILGFFIPYNELIGGAVAGYIAGGSLGRAVLAGFLAGIIGGLMLSVLILALLPFLMPYLAPLLGPLTGLLPLVALIPIALSLKGALLSAIGGAVGGAVALYRR